MPSTSANVKNEEHDEALKDHGGTTAQHKAAGTVLTCTNAECGCRLRIEVPCPHGDTYVCACGHEFRPVGSGPPTDIPT